jgi:hypothetical protein
MRHRLCQWGSTEQDNKNLYWFRDILWNPTGVTESIHGTPVNRPRNGSLPGLSARGEKLKDYWSACLRKIQVACF